MKEKEQKNYTKKCMSDFSVGKFNFQKFAYFIVFKIILNIFYKIEIKGIENIPKNGKFIVASNHISYFDAFLIWAPIKRPIAFMAKKELFEHKVLAFLIDKLGCFAVNREKLEVSTIKTAINIFKTPDWLLGIFPQGGIRRNKKIEKINKGFAVIAKQMKANILPIGLTGCENYNWIPFKGKITVSVGEIVPYTLDYDDIINEWGSKVADMIGYNYVQNSEPKLIQQSEPLVNSV